MVYYKLRQVLQSAMDLLQIATGITKCDDYYKLRQYMCAYLWYLRYSIYLVLVKCLMLQTYSRFNLGRFQNARGESRAISLFSRYLQK